MNIVIGSLLIIGVISFLVAFICMLLLPIAISEKKKEEGYEGGNLYGIPEMYQKEWYSEKKLWIRTGVIYGEVGFIASLFIAYILDRLSLI